MIKDGRKVVSYQLMDIEKGKQYLRNIGKLGINVPEITKLSDLNAEPMTLENNQIEIMETV